MIIPAYERARMTIDALNSVLAQSYRPIEVIVVDDGSRSDLKGPIEHWSTQAKTDEGFSVQYLRTENNGATVARNYGIRQSSGEFIQFLDNDDFLGQNKLTKQVAMMQNTVAKTAVYAASRVIYDDGGNLTLRKLATPRTEHTLHHWLSGEAVHSHSLLWRRADICDLGPWQEDLAANQDGEYAMRFLMTGGRLAYCPDTVVYYRYHVGGPRSVSKAPSHKANQSRYSVVEKVEQRLSATNDLDQYREELARYYLRLAPKFARYSPELSKACLNKAKSLSPNSSISTVFPRHYVLVYRLAGMKWGDKFIDTLQRWKHQYLTGFLPNYTAVENASSLYDPNR